MFSKIAHILSYTFHMEMEKLNQFIENVPLIFRIFSSKREKKKTLWEIRTQVEEREKCNFNENYFYISIVTASFISFIYCFKVNTTEEKNSKMSMWLNIQFYCIHFQLYLYLYLSDQLCKMGFHLICFYWYYQYPNYIHFFFFIFNFDEMRYWIFDKYLIQTDNWEKYNVCLMHFIFVKKKILIPFECVSQKNIFFFVRGKQIPGIIGKKYMVKWY